MAAARAAAGEGGSSERRGGNGGGGNCSGVDGVGDGGGVEGDGGGGGDDDGGGGEAEGGGGKRWRLRWVVQRGRRRWGGDGGGDGREQGESGGGEGGCGEGDGGDDGGGEGGGGGDGEEPSRGRATRKITWHKTSGDGYKMLSLYSAMGWRRDRRRNGPFSGRATLAANTAQATFTGAACLFSASAFSSGSRAH